MSTISVIWLKLYGFGYLTAVVAVCSAGEGVMEDDGSV